MRLDKLLATLAATLTVLATWMLAVSERAYIQAVIVTVLAIVALVFNDLRGKLTLSLFYTNIAAIFVSVLAIAQMRELSGDELLLAMADVLVYLQVVLLFKRKTSRDYWLIMVSNMLEVAVSAALNLNVTFALFMTAYSITGVFALGLFLLRREHELFAMSPPLSKSPPTPVVTGRWPLAQESSSFRVSPKKYEVTIQSGREYLRRMLGVLGWTMVLTVVMFFAIPRIGQTAFRNSFAGSRIVGFSEEVRLDAFGQIAERFDRVMRVQLTDVDSSKPITLVDAPLWRGGTLVSYEEGVWKKPAKASSPSRVPNHNELSEERGLVLQQITIEPTDTAAVWCLFPPIKSGITDPVDYDLRRDQLTRRSPSMRRFTCKLLTAGIVNYRQVPLTPQRGALDDETLSQLLQLPANVRGVDPLANLKQIAQSAVAPFPVSEPIERAKALEFYLSDPKRFTYTLNLPQRDPKLDPIEDFMTNRPTGHCEYFASALALMLRSVGIPSRIVVGFKGGEIDAITSAYDVQQADAHSWVEAYIPPEHVPEQLRDTPLWRSVPRPNGAWLRLDPTPFVRATEAAQQGVISYLFHQTTMYARAIWANYVVGMDAARQRELIYEPVLAGLAAMVQAETWSGLAVTLRESFQMLLGSLRQGDAAAWFQVLFGLALAALLSLALARVGRALLVRWRRWQGARRKRAAVAEIGFYRQLERLLTKAGLTRSRQQTPREFAFSVGGELSDRAETVGVASVPRKVVEAFYRVRFGHRPLDNDEALSVEQSLSQLAESLERRRGNKPR